MVFIGRERELKVLNDIYAKGGFRTFALYGRRRVGKSAMLRQFCTDKKSLFFVSGRYSEAINLELFRNCIFSLTGKLPRPYGNFIEAFTDMKDVCGKEKIVVVIDEYPYLIKTAPYVSSLLQTYIDHELKDSDIFLILCGSSMHTMVEELDDGDAPLFGRFLNRMELRPMSYVRCTDFHKDLSADDNLKIYGAVGGIPLYHSMFSGGSFAEGIMKNFVTGTEMSEEAKNIVLMELMPARTYGSIISAMSAGANRISTIADKAGIDGPLCSKCLNNMIFLGIAKKEILLANSNKKPTYVLKDNFLRFHSGVIEKCVPLISSGRTEEACGMISEMFRTHMGDVFEEVCAEFLSKRFPCVSVGTWRRSDVKTKTAEEIDIVAEVFDKKGNYCILAECKYSVSKVGSDVLNGLEMKAELVKGLGEKKLALFSRSGFEDRLTEHAEKNGILLFDLEDIYR
ncbi:MAG: AAA family ATPase [Methanomassiliicoccaceae archaeon]|nr:AAA family ATPase [Methanomassiliicoccaceae archaeon]